MLRKSIFVYRRSKAGFVMVAFTLALVLLVGSAGLTFDIGRMYITRNEAQSYCDAAAVAAALQLDDSAAGIANAKAAALAIPKRWGFGNSAFNPNDVKVEFAKNSEAGGPASWVEAPSPAKDYVYARVTASVKLPMYLIPVATGKLSSTIAASASAKQIPITVAEDNIFPFAPLWLPPGGSTPADTTGDPYGMVPAKRPGQETQHGGIYTLRGPSNIKDKSDMCANDATDTGIDNRQRLGHPDRGYIWPTNSASDIRNAILGNEVPKGAKIKVGDSVVNNCDYCLVEGTKQTEVKAIQDRVSHDNDPNALWFKDYEDAGYGTGPGGRYVVVPIITGVCSTMPGGCPAKPDGTGTWGDYTVIGFAGFFLRPANTYPNGGNNPICAEYIGPWVPGQGGGGTGSSGTMVGLVQ